MRLLKSLLLLFCFSLFSLNVAATPVDINQADAKTLARVMNGIGPKKAEAIVAYRETHGPFESIHTLVKIKGIGRKTVELNMDRITVGEVPQSQPIPQPAE